LREAAGDRWGNASYLLGGWSGHKGVDEVMNGYE
jgi:hypothetical protein